MRLILIGCEYSGTTTLAAAINGWAEKVFGERVGFHDHWKVPHISHAPHTDEENEQFMALSPNLKESFQRYHMEYHVSPSFYGDPHHSQVGFHIDEAVYAPLYYGYGGDDEYADRKWLGRRIEAHIMEVAPDTALILVKASPEVIARRMKENPHPYGLVQEKDIELVLKRFEEEYTRSFLRKKFTLDTNTASVEETLAEFVKEIEVHITPADRLKMLTRGMTAKGGLS